MLNTAVYSSIAESSGSVGEYAFLHEFELCSVSYDKEVCPCHLRKTAV